MPQLEQYLNGIMNVRLYSVDYQAKPLPNENSEEEIQINCNDKIANVFHSDDTLTVICERSMLVQPEYIMEVHVAFSVEHRILPEYIGKINWDNHDLKAEVLNNLPKFVPNEFSRLSLIISQLTSAFEGLPIVTPPSCMIETDENQNTVTDTNL